MYYYIEYENKVVLVDTDKQRLLNTLQFIPPYKNLPINESEQEVKLYKSVEDIEKYIRAKRDKYLQDTDIYMISDYPITDELREEYKKYRAYLRDIPQNPDFLRVPVLSFNDYTTHKKRGVLYVLESNPTRINE